MGDHADHKSRTAWEEMEPAPDTTGDAPLGHDHKPPTWIVRAVIALGVAIALAAVGLVFGAIYIYQQQQYIAGRGHLRDVENARLREEIRRSTCDLLDTLPASAVLEAPRKKYGCGPGIPVSQLPPAIRQHWHPAAPPTAEWTGVQPPTRP